MEELYNSVSNELSILNADVILISSKWGGKELNIL